jgi:hypothetical protein
MLTVAIPIPVPMPEEPPFPHANIPAPASNRLKHNSKAHNLLVILIFETHLRAPLSSILAYSS